MKCYSCNIVIEDDMPYCMDTETHGGYVCDECCSTVEALPYSVSIVCPDCGASVGAPCASHCVVVAVR